MPATDPSPSLPALLPQVSAIIRDECEESVLPRDFGLLLQRRLKLGYITALEIVDHLEERGYIGAKRKDGTREIFTLPEPAEETKPEPTHTMPKASKSAQQPTHDELVRAAFADIRVPEAFNVRADFGDSLEESIAEHGIQSAVLGWRDEDGQLNLVEGERRWRGLRDALDSGKLKHHDPKAQVPFIVRPGYADEIVRTTAMLTFGGPNGAKPLTMSERARAIERLSDLGKDNTEIAKSAGITATAVADHLDLLTLVHEDILAHVDQGRCAATFALELARTITDKDAQWIHFSEAMDKAGPDTRISAKHLSIAIGKLAKKKTPPPDDARPGITICRVCKSEEESEAATLWPEKDLCPKCHDIPMQNAGETGVDHEGRIHKNTEHPLTLPEESKTKVTLLVAEHTPDGSETPRQCYGYEVKWPGVFIPGRKDQKGYVKVLPNIKGPSTATVAMAMLYAAQAARCELEVQDYAEARGDKPAALAALTAQIESFARDCGGAVHTPPPVTSHQSPVTPPSEPDAQPTATPAPIPPTGDFSEFFTLCYQLRDHYTGGKPAPKFDGLLSAVRERLTNHDAMLARAERTVRELEKTRDQYRDQLTRVQEHNEDAAKNVIELTARITELESTSHQSPVTNHSGEAASTIAALTHVLDNAPDAAEREPQRLETIEVIRDAFTGALSPTASAKLLTEWVIGLHQTPEEAREAAAQ
jgi:ParB-like chromosome segregation protein Spo0J